MQHVLRFLSLCPCRSSLSVVLVVFLRFCFVRAFSFPVLFVLYASSSLCLCVVVLFNFLYLCSLVVCFFSCVYVFARASPCLRWFPSVVFVFPCSVLVVFRVFSVFVIRYCLVLFACFLMWQSSFISLLLVVFLIWYFVLYRC